MLESTAGAKGSLTPIADWPVMPAEYCEQQWYAAYTRPNHEKCVAGQLHSREVEHFLPTYSAVRRWKDRRVTLDVPLFSGYVFVRIALTDKLNVVQVPGVVRLVGFNGIPAALPDEEIEALRTGFAAGLRAEPHRYLSVGRRVRVKNGPLAGMEGILLRRKGSLRVVISVQLIRRAMAAEICASNLEPAIG